MPGYGNPYPQGGAYPGAPGAYGVQPAHGLQAPQAAQGMAMFAPGTAVMVLAVDGQRYPGTVIQDRTIAQSSRSVLHSTRESSDDLLFDEFIGDTCR